MGEASIMHTIGLASLILSSVAISITMDAETTSISEGEMFELKCATSLQYPVVWYFLQPDVTYGIFMGGEISKAFKDMFLLTGNQSLGEYNLRISSADFRYAGNYSCLDDEGLGSELVSIQLNIIASTSTPDIQMFAQHAPDAVNFEALEAAASSSQNDVGSNSINNTTVVLSTVIPIVVVIVAIVVVALTLKLKKRPAVSYSKDPEGQLQHSTDPRKKLPNVTVTSYSDASATCKESDSSANPRSDLLDGKQRPRMLSQLSDSSEKSDSSTTPLVDKDKDRMPVA